MKSERVAVVHGYGDFPRRAGKPDISSSFQVLAAGELLRLGRIDRVVFLTGSIKSGESSIAKVMYDQLRANLPRTSKDRVIANPLTITTRGEMKYFLQMARENGWTDLLAIGKQSHLRRIRRAARRFSEGGQFVEVKSAEDILTQEVPSRYVELVNKFRASKEEQSFIERENIINLIDSIPVVGGPMLDVLQGILGNKDFQNRFLKRSS